MSDNQPEQHAELTPPAPPAGDRWGGPITSERAAELKALADQQRAWAAAPDHQGRESYFKDVRLTGAEVFWLAAYALAGSEGDLAAAQERLRTAHDRDEFLDLSALHLEGADLIGAHLEGATLTYAHLEGANLFEAHLEGAHLSDAHLEDAYLQNAHLEGTELLRARLTGADLAYAHLGGKTLSDDDYDRVQRWATEFPKTLLPSDLHGAFFDTATYFDYAELGDERLGSVSVADVRWGGANLATVDWAPVQMLGDEREARQSRDRYAKPKGRLARLREFERAVRANRQVATVLRGQGINEHADRFAYRAQMLQRAVLRRQGKWLRWAGSLVLGLIAGYGYRPLRSFATYLLVVGAFALVYLALGGAHGQPLSWNESLVVSLTAFHGRGFFATAFQPGDPQAAVAAVEAVIGLFIEISFIATFTQRFFGSK